MIVGASLAGLRAAETLRKEGFTGELVIIGDEAEAPYDRPPLSKNVLAGRLGVDHTWLPQLLEIEADWRLGSVARRLSIRDQTVELADGQILEFDRLLIATGVRARPWPNPVEAELEGVFAVRSRDDARALRAHLADKPGRVLIVGAGFIGSEVASACREMQLETTVVDRSLAPVASALGQTVGQLISNLYYKNGVDLRNGVTVASLEADSEGRVRRARLSDGSDLDVSVVVAALGSMRNTEWLEGSGLAADGRGVVCDASCRAVNEDFVVLDNVFVAGDVARWPHPIYAGEFLAVEHWNNAVEQARTAAHNMICAALERRPHNVLPAFWSHQFGVNIKSVGVAPYADEVMVTQGSLHDHRFVAAYGRGGRVVAAVTFNYAMRLPAYRSMIESFAAFPPDLHAPDAPSNLVVLSAAFPAPKESTHASVVRTTGYLIPNEHLARAPAA